VSFVTLGRVLKTRGLDGEVVVAPAAGLPDALVPGLQVWFVPPPDRDRVATISSVRPGPKGIVLDFDPILATDAAADLAGRSVLARVEDVPEPVAEPADSAVGLRVIDATRGDLGVVDEVIVTGANDVWIVHGPLGEVLIPVIDDCVLDVDRSTGTASVRLLPGLIPDEDGHG